MKWNDRLKQARDAAGVSDTEIAIACGVKPPSVFGWMSGETKNIEAHNLLAACKLLKVSPIWVIYGEAGPADETFLPESIEVPAFEIIRLISLYAKATMDGKRFIISAAESAEKD